MASGTDGLRITVTNTQVGVDPATASLGYQVQAESDGKPKRYDSLRDDLFVSPSDAVPWVASRLGLQAQNVSMMADDTFGRAVTQYFVEVSLECKPSCDAPVNAAMVSGIYIDASSGIPDQGVVAQADADRLFRWTDPPGPGIRR